MSWAGAGSADPYDPSLSGSIGHIAESKTERDPELYVDSPRASSQASNSNKGTLRKGKWTLEEEKYANKIIYMFNKGILQIPLGTTLRSYLSEKLNWYR